MGVIQNVESWIVTNGEKVLDTAWAALKPAILAFGQTLLSQIGTAAGSVASGSATYSQAFASLIAQIPEDVEIAEEDLAAALSAAIKTVTTPDAAS